MEKPLSAQLWAALWELEDKLRAVAGVGGLACGALEGLGSFCENLDFHTVGITFFTVVLILTRDLEYKPKKESYCSSMMCLCVRLTRSEWARDS